jgi:crotonobetainyl-CoA:carnitine CoA-transferase CaiB-like acyl-CoA transferase
MQNVLYRLSETPGEINWTGRAKGQDTHEILAQTLGLAESKIAELEAAGIISQNASSEGK